MGRCSNPGCVGVCLDPDCGEVWVSRVEVTEVTVEAVEERTEPGPGSAFVYEFGVRFERDPERFVHWFGPRMRAESFIAEGDPDRPDRYTLVKRWVIRGPVEEVAGEG